MNTAPFWHPITERLYRIILTGHILRIDKAGKPRESARVIGYKPGWALLQPMGCVAIEHERTINDETHE